MNFNISPYEGVGSIKFGMNQSEVRQILNAKASLIERIELWDDFAHLGIQVSYDYKSPHICRAVMLYEPSKPVLYGKNLLDGTTIRDLRNWLELTDDHVEVVTEGVISYKFGVYLSCQDYELFDRMPPESIVVFEKDYYKDLGSDVAVSNHL